MCLEYVMSDWTETSRPIPALRGGANAGIDLEAVELANAYGPYAHGIWISQELSDGNEEALSGRCAFLVPHIRRAILEKFTIEHISGMTLFVTQIFAILLIHNLHQPSLRAALRYSSY